MKSLILMGIVACVVVPMTWTVDAQQLCDNEKCRGNGKCRTVIRGNNLEAHCVLDEEIHENFEGCINAKPLLQYQGGDGYHLQECGESNPCPNDFSCRSHNTASYPDRVCCPSNPERLNKRWGHQRIVGGSTATYGEHPSICSVQVLRGSGWIPYCGCIIWNKDYVVTAAHCLDPPASQYRVAVGKHSYRKTDSHQANHTVSEFTLNPQFDDSDMDKGLPNDIAVMKLDSSITFNTHVKKATFAQSGSFVGENCLLLGWGWTSDYGDKPDALQKVNLTAISNSDCMASMGSGTIYDGNICFQEKYGLSACMGDSGGPVYCGQYVTGLTSWGDELCNGTLPVVYTRVSTYYKWLVSIAGSN